MSDAIPVEPTDTIPAAEEQPLETPKPKRSFEELSGMYQQRALRVGDLTYRVNCHNSEIAGLIQECKEINHEAAMMKVEEAKAKEAEALAAKKSSGSPEPVAPETGEGGSADVQG